MDLDEARARLQQLAAAAGSEEHYYLFDPEEADPQEKGKNTRLFNGLDNLESGSTTASKVNCIVTWQVGIRGINYWKQCYPVAWYPLQRASDYEQFLGRSNRQYPQQMTQRGAVILAPSTATAPMT